MRFYVTKLDGLTPEELRTLIVSGDDNHDNQIRYTKSGMVFYTKISLDQKKDTLMYIEVELLFYVILQNGKQSCEMKWIKY